MVGTMHAAEDERGPKLVIRLQPPLANFLDQYGTRKFGAPSDEPFLTAHMGRTA